MFESRSHIPGSTQEKEAAVIEVQNCLPTSPQRQPPPPPYSACIPGEDSPDITAAFVNLKLEPQSTVPPKPTADQCLAHLKLLEAFHSLREDICRHDGLFGILDSFAKANDTTLLTKIREKRWQVYVSKAAKRFELWWKNCVMPNAKRQSQYAVTTLSRTPWEGKTLRFLQENLPPLDVLMVWHAYQLNPRNFLEDCVLLGKMNAWRTGLPWAVINSCIDDKSFQYDAGPAAKELFETETKYRWDSLEDPQMADIQCSKCDTTYSVPWTEWNTPAAWNENAKGHSLWEDDNAHGFADKHFQVACTNRNCHRGLYTITHEELRAAKFFNDCKSLRYQDTPMQGTCLDIKGLPESLPHSQGRPSFFPNRLIKGTTTSQSVFNDLRAAAEAKFPDSFTMNDVRSEIEKGFKDRDYVLAVNTTIPTKDEKIAFRRMMSCYWDNSSPFSLDLVGAVIRQGTFVAKMHRINWIHSPAARFTMQRLLTKYDRYLAIVTKAKAANKGQIAVPTLDVDLAWHTHQLCPRMYYQHTVTSMNMFLNHDDKIEDMVLSAAFEWTSKTYQKMYYELYSECTCWYCEAIRESHAPRLAGLNLRKRFGGKPDVIEEQLNQVHSAWHPDAEKNHISAHNSIRPDSILDRNIREKNLKYKLERDYQKAVVKARKKGREPPARDEYNQAHASLLYTPVYMPYESDACVPGSNDLYSTNPSCASYVAGASGNCASGTCGGGAAAGACGEGGNFTSGDAGGADGGDGGDGGGCGGGCGGCG